jgi:arginase family enzyme
MGKDLGLWRYPGYIVSSLYLQLERASRWIQRTNIANCLDRYDNAYALQQIEEGHNLLLSRTPHTNALAPGYSKKGKTLPRLITLGGDHTITLPLLRSINR